MLSNYVTKSSGIKNPCSLQTFDWNDFFAQKSDNVCCFLRIISWEFPQFFDLRIVNKILPQRHGLSFAGEETRTMVWVPFLYRFTVLQILNSAGSNSPWSEFWSEFPHFMGMGGILGAICLFFPPFGGVGAILAGFPHFGGHFGVICNFGWFSPILGHILGEILVFFPPFGGGHVGGNLAVFFPIWGWFSLILGDILGQFGLFFPSFRGIFGWFPLILGDILGAIGGFGGANLGPKFGQNSGPTWAQFSKIGAQICPEFCRRPKKNDKITTKLFLGKKPYKTRVFWILS